jgi:hypothetical protein
MADSGGGPFTERPTPSGRASGNGEGSSIPGQAGAPDGATCIGASGREADCVTCVMALAKSADDKGESSSAIPVALINLGAGVLWPVFIGLLLVIFRKRVGEFLDRLRDRLADPKQSVAAFGISVGPAQGQVETLGESVAQLSHIVRNQGAHPPANLKDQLKTLGQRYEHAKGATPKETGQLKSELGRQMGALVATAGPARRELVRELLTSGVEADVAAVAFAVLAEPTIADANDLCAVATRLQRNHPRYAIALALDRLAQTGLIASPAIALAAIEAMRARADHHLSRRLDATRLSILTWVT